MALRDIHCACRLTNVFKVVLRDGIPIDGRRYTRVVRLDARRHTEEDRIITSLRSSARARRH